MTAKHLSETNEQYTSADIVEMSREVLGQIDLDPASSLLANMRVKANQIFTLEDGEQTFEEDWNGNVFMNPPGGVSPLAKGTGIKSNPALFWSKLMYEWEAGRVQMAIVLGFTIEVLQVTQSGSKYPMLMFPFCIPRRRLRFDVPREEKLRQTREKLVKASEKSAKALEKSIQTLEESTEELVTGDSPPHGNVLVFVPPKKEYFHGKDQQDRPWKAWGGPFTQKFQDVFARIGYVRV